MQENVKIEPSFATIFTVYTMPEVTVKPVGIGNVTVHEDCTASTLGVGEGQLLPTTATTHVTSVVFLMPAMKKSAKVI